MTKTKSSLSEAHNERGQLEVTDSQSTGTDLCSSNSQDLWRVPEHSVWFCSFCPHNHYRRWGILCLFYKEMTCGTKRLATAPGHKGAAGDRLSIQIQEMWPEAGPSLPRHMPVHTPSFFWRTRKVTAQNHLLRCLRFNSCVYTHLHASRNPPALVQMVETALGGPRQAMPPSRVLSRGQVKCFPNTRATRSSASWPCAWLHPRRRLGGWADSTEVLGGWRSGFINCIPLLTGKSMQN